MNVSVFLCVFVHVCVCFQDYEVNECLKQLMMALLRAYRFSPIIPDLGFQVLSLIKLPQVLLDQNKSGHTLKSRLL